MTSVVHMAAVMGVVLVSIMVADIQSEDITIMYIKSDITYANAYCRQYVLLKIY